MYVSHRLRLRVATPTMKFFVYRDRKLEWRWRLKARNGRIVADSGEGYKSKTKCVRAVEKMVIECGSALIE